MSIIYNALSQLEAGAEIPSAVTETPDHRAGAGLYRHLLLALAAAAVLTCALIWQVFAGRPAPTAVPPAPEPSPQALPVAAVVAAEALPPPAEAPAEAALRPALDSGEVSPVPENSAAHAPAPPEAAVAAAVETAPDSASPAQGEGAPYPSTGLLPAEPAVEAVVATATVVEIQAVEKALDAARAALARGEYPRVMSLLADIAPEAEARGDYWFVKGSAQLAMNQLAAAEAALLRAQALAPDNAQIRLQRAILLQERGDHGGALLLLQQAGELHPDMPEIYLNRGYSQFALGELPQARRSFQLFLTMTRDHSLYQRQRAVIAGWLAEHGAR